MSQGGVYGTGPNQDNVRASDADRERIVEQLRQHAADGRLTMDEFEERMSAAYEAKTYGALSELTRDLPVDLSTGRSGGRSGGRTGQLPTADAPVDISAVVAGAINARMGRHDLQRQMHQQMREQRAHRRQQMVARRGRRGQGAALAGMGATWASVSVLLTGIWLIAGIADHGHFGDFWPIWPIGILGLLTLLKGLKFFGDH
jgi:Domain of unknown function (DUF1707)